MWPGIDPVRTGFGSEPYCSVFRSEVSHSVHGMAQERNLSAKSDGLSTFLREGLPRPSGSRCSSARIRKRSPSMEGTWSGRPGATIAANGRSAMRCEDLMSPDLLSEIGLLGSDTLVLVSLLLFVVTAFTRA
jgi:hypothetical protein